MKLAGTKHSKTRRCLLLTSKISKPAMSRMPRKDEDCLLLLSRVLFTLARIQRKRRSYMAFASASMAKSAWSRRSTAGVMARLANIRRFPPFGYLLLGLRLLHHLSAHFDPRGEDGAGEVGHTDALQVAHLLGR